MQRLGRLAASCAIALVLVAGLGGCGSTASYPSSGGGTSVAPAQPIEKVVYVTNTGSKYHRAGCQYLSHSQIAVSVSDAVGRGFTPCSVCNP